MASQTSALPDGSTLTKPAYTDSADIAVINTNMDKIVSNINAENQALSKVNSLNDRVYISSTSVPNSTYTTLVTVKVQESGNYLLDVNASYAAGDGIRILFVDVYEAENNNPINSVLIEGRATLQKIRMFQLTPNDTVYIRAYQNSGASMNVSGVYQLLRLK